MCVCDISLAQRAHTKPTRARKNAAHASLTTKQIDLINASRFRNSLHAQWLADWFFWRASSSSNSSRAKPNSFAAAAACKLYTASATSKVAAACRSMCKASPLATTPACNCTAYSTPPFPFMRHFHSYFSSPADCLGAELSATTCVPATRSAH